MQKDLAQLAISHALSGRWKEAQKINIRILNSDPKDINSLNRLARCYLELGNIDKARLYSNKVLKIDPFNKIALKSINRWSGLKNGDRTESPCLSGDEFIEEPGKTKIINLIFLGAGDVLKRLACADEAKLNLHGHRTSITTMDGKYIGRLPDDIGTRIKNFSKLGNQYKILIKSASEKEVKIFIKEIETAPNLINTPTFPAEKIHYISFTPPELVHNKSDIEISIEEE